MTNTDNPENMIPTSLFASTVADRDTSEQPVTTRKWDRAVGETVPPGRYGDPDHLETGKAPAAPGQITRSQAAGGAQARRRLRSSGRAGQRVVPARQAQHGDRQSTPGSGRYIQRETGSPLH